MFKCDLSAMLLISKTMYYSSSTSFIVIIFTANFQKNLLNPKFTYQRHRLTDILFFDTTEK